MKYSFLIFSLLLLITQSISYCQDEVYVDNYQEEVPDTNSVKNTFYSTRIINGHSVETLRKGVLEFRVEHRFGDIAGSDGGIQTMYGFDNSSDIRLAFEYGFTDKLMAGFGRSKGTGAPYRSLLDGFVKYKVLVQQKVGVPFSLTANASTSYSYMKASSDSSQVNSFPKWQHRMAYSLQLNFSRKFSDRISIAIIPSLVHRNYVAQDDVNTMFALGGAMRIGLTSTTALLLEYYHGFTDDDFRSGYKNSLGIAFEIITFGHNFTINLTNSKGFGETQFIPYTYSDWLKGQFRLGFCIGRKFERE